MAEKIVSPGVFTEEKDLSFLPQGIGEIGAAFIGPTVKGPAFVPTIVESGNEFEQVFGPTKETMYTPYAVKNYLRNAGRATIIRTLGLGGYAVKHPIYVIASGSGVGEQLISVLHPTFVAVNDDETNYFEKSNLVAGSAAGSGVLTISGSYTTDTSTFTNAINKDGTEYSASINSTRTDYIGDLFGYLPTGIEPVYNYVLFEAGASASLAADAGAVITISTGSGNDEWDFSSDYQAASTPWITSQEIAGNTINLFKFHHLSHGTDTNYEVKVQIENIRSAGTIPGSSYGAFNIVVRAVDQDPVYGSPYNYDDSDSRQTVLETFLNVNLNPDSPNFIQRRIGDKFITTDANGKLYSNGDYPNLSKIIRVEVADAVKAGATSANLVPFGFKSLFSPIPSGITQPPAASFVQDQNIGGIYNKKKPWGLDYNETDNYNYLKPLPIDSNKTVGNNVDFLLSNFNQPVGANYPTVSNPYTGSINLSSDTTTDSRKFVIPFQGGFDGWRPHLQRRTGANITAANSQGFNLTSGEWGDTAYRRALAAISNPDEFDINMLVTPGIINELHSGVVARSIEVCEDRSDAFYVLDGFQLTTNIAGAISAVATLDTNYAGTYYPWVKTLDVNRNKPMWVPPSVVMPGIIAYSDKVAEPWFAPAGLNRGGITEAIEAYTRLTHDERDDLYENRINPIASFPNEGVVAWGQKTLQAKPSALDRINVRRLLIALKKFIASSSRYLVFENNTAVTRNRFLNIVNPYLESVQQRQGLYAFKVVMDESNNTPDIIDRNIMYGQVFLQPAKTAEFIVLDFNILPTGAAFPE
jgi:hypothetical protein